MATSTAKRPYLDGVKQGLPFMIVVVPFAMLFGVVGTEAGLNLVQVMGFSVIVIAGAAQLTAVQLMVDEAPTIMVIITALAVNMRMAMYSAALTPYLGTAPWWQRGLIAYLLVDQSYAVSHAYFEEHPQLTIRQRVAFYLGAITPVIPLWYLGSLAGVLVGQGIPPEWALDFAAPITFVAVVAPAFRTVAHMAAGFVAVVASLLLAWVPYSGGVILAAALAMAVGAEIERRFLGDTL